VIAKYAARSARITGSGRKFRSSRVSRGNRPARWNEAARAGCAENDKEPGRRGLAEAARLIERVDAIGPSRPK
jgi:hypothetical protein